MREVTVLDFLGGYRVRLRFDDGVEGEIDIASVVPFESILSALRDPLFFGRARVHGELGVVYWPNGADLDSDVLYSAITGLPVSPTVGAALPR